MSDSQLVDAYGRPIVYEALIEEQAAAQFVGLRNIYSTIDDSIGLTPEKVIGILRNAEFGDPWLYLELAERMEEKDLLYQGVLHTRKMAVSQLDIDVQSADAASKRRAHATHIIDAGDAAAKELAAFVRQVLIDGDLDLHDAAYEMLDSLGKGFSATEIIWNTDGRDPKTGAPQWLPAALKWRDPRWFMFDWISGEQLLVRTLKTGGPQIPVGPNSWDSRLSPMNLRVRAAGDHEVGIQPATQPLAPFKFLTHVTRAKAGLPIRGGLARVAIWAYLFKNYVLKDWVVFAEVYGQPLRLGKYGPGATENDKATLLRAVANIGTDAAAIIPESMAIEFTETHGGGSKSHEMYEKLCEYIDKQVTIGVLGQELTTQLPRGSGSRAAAEVHDVVRRDIATDDARRLCATFNRDLVKPLVDLNRGPQARYPKVIIGFTEQEDLLQLAQSLGPFIDRGAPVPRKWLLEKFGVPEMQSGDVALHPIERIAISGDSSSVESGAPSSPAAPLRHPGQSPARHPERSEGSRPAAPEPAAAIASPSLAPAFTDVNHRERMAARDSSASPQNDASHDAINRFVARLLEDETEPAMRPIIHPLMARMRAARSYDEMRAAVADSVAGMGFEAFVELLARAGFNAQLAGNLMKRKDLA